MRVQQQKFRALLTKHGCRLKVAIATKVVFRSDSGTKSRGGKKLMATAFHTCGPLSPYQRKVIAKKYFHAKKKRKKERPE